MQWAIVTVRERSDIISLNFYLSQTPPTPVIQLSHISNFCMWFITFLLVFILSEIIPPSLSMSVMIFDRSLSTDHSCRRYWCYYCCCCCVTTTKDTLPITQVSFMFLSSGNQCWWSFYICPPTVINRLDFICMSPSPSPPLPSPPLPQRHANIWTADICTAPSWASGDWDTCNTGVMNLVPGPSGALITI